MNRKVGTTTMDHLLDDERIRRTQLNQRTHYAAADLLAVLTGSPSAQADWNNLKHFEPSLRTRCVHVELPGSNELQDLLPLSGVMRLIQTIDPSYQQVQRLQGWMAEVAARRVEEEADPELAIGRLRRSYGEKGQSRHWIDQRLRSISARQELVHEWYQRGVKDSEEFRTLTNKLMEVTFGMDVNAYRQAKQTTRNLRDHLSDLELSLLSLAETTAASLHRSRRSVGMDALLHDVEEAGRIISQTRQQITQATAASSAAA